MKTLISIIVILVGVGCSKPEDSISGTYESETSKLVLGNDSFFEMRLKPKGDYIVKGRWEVINGGINLEHHRFEEITSLRFEKNGDLTVIATTKYVKGNLEKRDYQEKDFITYKKIKNRAEKKKANEQSRK